MEATIQAQLELYKDKIPEFIVKLCHILEQPEFNDYLCWYGDNQILIKSGKKLEQKVLPHFFRHRHLSSFVRQLNMYKFGKVNKLTKQKHHMYFKNEYFKRGQIKQMAKIKRNNKKSRRDDKEEDEEGKLDEANSQADNSDNLSIKQELENTNATLLTNYRAYVQATTKEIYQQLKKIQISNPDLKHQLALPISICSQMMELSEAQQPPPSNMTYLNFEQNANKNMLSTMRLLPRMESLIFPSQCSFYQLNNV